MARRVTSTQVDNKDSSPSTSRYRNARYYQRSIPGVGDRIEPGTWLPPSITLDETDLVTQVQPGEEGRLDLISLRLYGISALWWVLAYLNDIIDPFEEVTPDLTLRYPSFENVVDKVLS